MIDEMRLFDFVALDGLWWPLMAFIGLLGFTIFFQAKGRLPEHKLSNNEWWNEIFYFVAFDGLDQS